MAQTNPNVAEKMMEILVETERVADRILVIKQEKIALDKKRQSTREALTNLRKSNEKKCWITIGSMLFKMEKTKAMQLMEKDQIEIDKEITGLSNEQKILINRQRELEFMSPLKGFDLKPLNHADVSAFKANLPTF